MSIHKHFLLIFVCLAWAMYTQSATYDQKQKYLNELINIQSKIKSNVAMLQDLNKKNILTAANFKSQNQLQKTVLEQAIVDQRNLIQQTLIQGVIPLSQNYWNCKDLTVSQKQLVSQKIQSLKQKSTSIKQSLSSLSSCTRNIELQSTSQLLDIHISSLQQQLSNTCTNPNRKDKNTANNTTTNNTTSNATNNNGNTTTGTNKTPTSNTTNSTITSNTTSNTTTIPTIPITIPTIPANQTKNSLSSAIFNYIGQAPKNDIKLQTCPTEQPIFNIMTRRCIACGLPYQYFDFNTQSCVKCQQGKQFNLERKQCQVPVIKLNPNINENITNYCCGKVTVNPGLQTCPASRPYFSIRSCIQCSPPLYFNLTSQQCTSCPANQSFSSSSSECIISTLLIPIYKSNPLITNYKGIPPQIKPTSNQIITICPIEYPFANGKECWKCQGGFFNFDEGLCEVCQGGMRFDVATRTCQLNNFNNVNITNINNTNISNGEVKSNTLLVGDDNWNGTVPIYQRNYSDCPNDKRYFNAKQCVSCQLPMFFDFSDNKCKQCNNGLAFDTIAKQCFYLNQIQSTNVKSSKIYYNGNFTQLKSKLQNQKKPSCPQNSPFFDKSLNQCISCPEQNNLFNILHNSCMSCPKSTYFNQEYHICLQNGVKPTLQRMMMNSVIWI